VRCGGSTTETVTKPVDLDPRSVPVPRGEGPLKRYDVGGLEIDGRIMPTDAILKLDEATAKRLGVSEVKDKRRAPAEAATKKAAPAKKAAATKKAAPASDPSSPTSEPTPAATE
jgi:hypothetical protein